MDPITPLVSSIFTRLAAGGDAALEDSILEVISMLQVPESNAAFLANNGIQLLLENLEAAPDNLNVAKVGLLILSTAVENMEVDAFPTLNLQTRCLTATVKAMEMVMPAPPNVVADDFELALAGAFILQNVSVHHVREVALFTNKRAPAVLLSLLKCFTLPLAQNAEDFEIIVTLLTWVLKHEECAPIDPQVIPIMTRLVHGGLPELSLRALQFCLDSILFCLVRREEDAAPAPVKMQQFIAAGGIDLIQKAMRLHCRKESYLTHIWTAEVLKSDVGRAALLARGGMHDILHVMRRALEAQNADMVLVAIGPMGYRSAPPHHNFLAAFVEAGGHVVLDEAALAYPENGTLVRMIEMTRDACVAAGL
jgi:hypothetical protein